MQLIRSFYSNNVLNTNFMKKIILLLTCILYSVTLLNAQIPYKVKYTSPYYMAYIKKNIEFEIDSIKCKFNDDKTLYFIIAEQSGKQLTFSASDIKDAPLLKASEDNIQNFWLAKNISSLKYLSNLTNLYEKRGDVENDANEYVNRLYSNGFLLDDQFLESYLYSIISKIAPSKRADGFPYDINIKIVKDPSINAAMYPNGTMLVNTGLLAAAHTEDEIAAVLSHEIAHFVANHTLVNIARKEKAQARAEFWASMGAVLATVIEDETSSSRNNGYALGSAAILSYSIVNAILDRVGMNYDKEQEEDADKSALEALKYLGYDKNALATIFQRMANAYQEESNWAAYYTSEDHPSLIKRIHYSGTPNFKVDVDYEKKVSFAVSSVAEDKFCIGNFRQALKLVNQNIKNNIGTDNDYLIKGLCLLNLYDDPVNNKEAYSMILKAKSINSDMTDILRAEVVACLRNNDLNNASTAIDKYAERLQEEINRTDQTSYQYRFLHEELYWAQKMAIKVRGL